MYNIGVDVGGTKIALGLVDENGKIIDRELLWNSAGARSDEVMFHISEKINDIIIKNKLVRTDINSIGIGFPGKVSNEGNVNAPNVAFHNVHFLDHMKSLIKDIPVYVENDANCAAVAEYIYGGLQNAKDSILITLGTGVGGGIIIDGKIYTGQAGGAGELGHQVIVLDGKKCGCGRSGCLEAYASTRALVERLKENINQNEDSMVYKLVDGDVSKLSAKIFFEALGKGDVYANEMFKEHAKYIAIGLMNLILIFDPKAIAIGGGVSGQKEKLLNPILDEIEKCKGSVFNIDDTKICIAELGNDAGIIGAAELYRMKN